jgi:hypothetical protein
MAKHCRKPSVMRASGYHDSQKRKPVEDRLDPLKRLNAAKQIIAHARPVTAEAVPWIHRARKLKMLGIK